MKTLGEKTKQAFGKDNRFITISILICGPLIGFLMYLAIADKLNPQKAVLLIFLIAVLPILILGVHFLRTHEVL